MLKINRQTKIKYRKLFEDYLFRKYATRISHIKYPKIIYRRTQLKMF